MDGGKAASSRSSLSFKRPLCYRFITVLAITAGKLYWLILIGLVGMGFLMYGRKRPDTVALLTGIVLLVYPYFIASTAWSIAAGLAIILVFVVLKKIVRI